jgi:hypothetical protein
LPAVVSGDFHALPPLLLLIAMVGMYGFGFAIEIRRIRTKLAEVLCPAESKAT